MFTNPWKLVFLLYSEAMKVTDSQKIPWSKLRILLVQVRDEEAAILQEQQCFVDVLMIQDAQLKIYNVVRKAELPSVSDFDALIIGGAGAFSATTSHPFYPRLNVLISSCLHQGIPIFGSCWGHQYLGRYFGGRVQSFPDRWEFGTKDVRLTEAGKQDPVFSRLPNVFAATQGHADQIVDPPSYLRVLAESDLCPVQAFRHVVYQVMGSQFHPELSKERFQERLMMYRNHYDFESEDAFWTAYHSTQETTASNGLIRDFFLETVAFLDLIA